MTPHTIAAFNDYLDRLLVTAKSDPDVVGLVVFGSTAARERVDEWSDHDFAWITRAGAEIRFRADLSWLPDADRIVLSTTADHGGVTVIYDDGHLIEFGVATVRDFAAWAGDRANVLEGGAAVQRATAAVILRGQTASRLDSARDVRLALAKILVGVGRARRGETLSARALIQGEAVDLLLRVLAARLPDDRGLLGLLDPRRRFEQVHPAFASRIADACTNEPEPAARTLFVIVTELAKGWDEYPAEGAAAIGARLGWS